MPGLEYLQIVRIALHEIFPRGMDGMVTQPRLSERLAELGPDGVAALRDRLLAALGKDSHCLEMRITNDGEGSAAAIFSTMVNAPDEDFLRGSRDLARRLCDVQTSRRIPGGIVVVISGTVGQNQAPFIAVIKAEEHTAFMLLNENETIGLQFLSKVLLTREQKLFKIGFFMMKDGSATQPETLYADDFEVYVYDHVLKVQAPAVYFSQGFLSCEPAKNGRFETARFYGLTSEFIQGMNLTPEGKVEFNLSLAAYLSNPNRATIHVAEFADDALPEDARNAYRSFMEQQNFSSNLVPNDPSALQRALKTKRLEFENGISLSAPIAHFGNNVSIETTDDATIVRIRGQILKQS